MPRAIPGKTRVGYTGASRKHKTHAVLIEGPPTTGTPYDAKIRAVCGQTFDGFVWVAASRDAIDCTRCIRSKTKTA